MPYEGASITIFDQPLGEEWQALWKSAAKENATRTERMVGEEVLVFKRKYEDDDWTFYLAQPKPDVVVLATNRSYLEELLIRMAKPAKTRGVPESLPEWKHLDMSKPLWALRHYDRKDALNDPSSPLEADDQAIGFVFTFDLAKDDLAVVKYLSGNEDALRLAKENWTHPNEDLTPDIRRSGSGVIEISLPLKGPSGSDAVGMYVLVLLNALGHGIYM